MKLKQATDALWRIFLAFGRALLAWSPTLLLTVLGAIYLFNCLEVLAAPGTGLDIAYTGRGGTIHISAESYSIDPVSQTLGATGVTVRNQQGEVVAQAKKIFVARKAETFDARVYSVTGTIVRRKDGTFNTLDILPPHNPDAKPKPIHLMVDRAQLTVSDQSGQRPVAESLIVRGLEFSSDGKQNVVSGDFDWGGAAKARINAAFDRENRFKAQVTGLAANLNRMRPLANAFLDLKTRRIADRWQADDLSLAGDATVAGDEKHISSIHGELALTGKGIRDPDYFRGAALAARVSLYSQSAQITARVEEPGRMLSWDGPVSWSGGFSGSGKVVAVLADSRRAWPAISRAIPKGVALAGGRFEGVASIDRGKVSVSGNVSADRIDASGERVGQIAGNVVADGERVSVVIDRAIWQSAALKGWVTADYRGNFVAGEVETVGDKIVPLEFPLDNGVFVLAARAKALLTGTPADPQILADVAGYAQLSLGDKDYLLGEVDARIGWRKGLATIERAVASGPNGVLSASGSVNTDKQALNLEVEAGGVDLSAYTNQLTGVAYGSGTLTGTFQSPRAVLEATVLNLRAGDTVLPRTEATLAFDGKQVSASRIVSQFGLGRVTGQATYDIESGGILANLAAKDIFLADLLPDAPFVGRVDSDAITVSGTLDEPEFQATAHSSDLIVAGVPVDSVALQASGLGTRIRVDSLQGRIGNGAFDGSGSFDLADKRAKFEFKADGIPLGRLPVDAELLDVTGTAGVAGAAQSDENGKWSGQATLSIEGMEVNQFEAGSGQFQIDLANGVLAVSGGVSSISGLVEVPEAAYRLDDGSVAGTLIATNVEIGGIIRAASRQISIPDIQAERVVRDLEGLVSAEIGFTQTGEQWSIDVKSLVASRLESLGRSLGAVDLAGSGTATEANLKKFSWRAPAGGEEGEAESIAELIGTWKKGEGSDHITAEGRLVGFDPHTLNLFIDNAPEFHARINADFVAEGQTDNLTGQASLTASDFQTKGADGKLSPIDLSANVDTIEFSNQTLTASGKLRFRGIEGDIEATAPLDAFEEHPNGQAEASLTLTKRPISTLAEYFPGIDFSRTHGSIFGQIRASGNRDGYTLGGEARFGADGSGPAQFALQSTNLLLQGVEFALLTSGEKATITGQAQGAEGGTVAVQGDINLRRFLQGELDFDALLAATIEGGIIQIDNLRASEKIQLANPGAGPGEPEVLAADKPTQAVVNGMVKIGGTLGAPTVSGNLEAENLNITLPPAFPATQRGGSLPVDPQFQDFRLVARPGATLNIPTGNIKLSGAAVLNGHLSEVDIRAPFTVKSGEMNLPSSRINLEEGTVVVTVGAGSDPRADLNIEGWTVVTVRRTSDQYQTYRLNLQIQGNLLDPENVRINGSSDPPDLSVEEIRAIIGQRDFIQSIADSAFGNPSQRSGITQSLFSLAVPSLTQRFTGSLATALDLDYLALDYNPFDGAVIRGGRELAKGLMIEGSRQVARQGVEQLKFELRLSYRPPTKDILFSRFRVFAGVNEQVPWKVGISYSTRF
ncbi:MAG: hypothetical protein JNM28_10025 [Armatimonadetes bacterium]|nr:hypothetical protein [Armatimonadota bacterium]